jgi:hypothetical protein
MLLLRHLPALRKFCCLFHTEELTRHIEDVTLLFLDMVLDMLIEHLKLLVPCFIVHARRGSFIEKTLDQFVIIESFLHQFLCPLSLPESRIPYSLFGVSMEFEFLSKLRK